MIEINLLPEDLKSRAKAAEKNKALGRFLYFIPLFFGLLLLVHLGLFLVFAFKGYQIGMLSGKWKGLEPQRKALAEARKEYDLFSQDNRITKQLEGRHIRWAKKLERLSIDLPAGIWFNEATLSSKEFVLKGSVVSLKKEEMSLVNKLIESLKSDALFFNDFSGFELGSVQIRTVGGYDVVDFTLSAKTKLREADKPKNADKNKKPGGTR